MFTEKNKCFLLAGKVFTNEGQEPQLAEVQHEQKVYS